MLKRFGVYTVLSFLQPAIGVFLLPLILSLLTKEDYGRYTLFYGLVQLANVFLGLKTNSIMIAYWNNFENRIQLLKETLGLQSVTLVIMAVPVFVFAGYFLDGLLGIDSSQGWMFSLVLVVTGVVVSLHQTFMQYAKLSADMPYFIKQSISSAVLTLFCQILGVYYFGLLGLFTGRMIAVLIVLQFNFVLLDDFLPTIPSLKKSKSYLKFVMPFLFWNVSIWLSLYIDRFLVRGFFTLEELGLHGLIMTIAGLLGLLVNSSTSAIMPELLDLHKKSYQQSMKEVATSVKKLSYSIILCYMLIVITAYITIPLLKESKYDIPLDYLSLACFGSLVRLFLFPRSAVLMAEKQSMTIAKAEVGGLLSFLLFSYFMSYYIQDLRIVYLGKFVGLSVTYITLSIIFIRKGYLYVPFPRSVVIVSFIALAILLFFNTTYVVF